ncbi:LysR family transcriptional regulator [Aeromonas sanarellii]|uniref:LysR family transcriptional regulator n=1 Tax=Aeromonas sanarellii TaxID=633415 RepID=UPI00399F0B17
MKLSLDALLVLEAIDKCGSLTAAAEKLFKTPSALSYTIQKLESELSFALLDRSGHKVTFTEKGRIVLDKGKDILSVVRTAEQQINSLKELDASLTIGIDIAFPFHYLPPVLNKFYEKFPHVNVTIVREILDGVWEGLIDERFDIVLGALSKPPSISKFGYHHLGQLEHVFVHAPMHPLAFIKAPLTPLKIKRYRAVTVGNIRRNIKTDLLISDDQAVIKVDGFSAKIELLLSGVGCGYLPKYLAAPHIKNNRLVGHVIEGRGICETAYIGWNNERRREYVSWWLKEVELMHELVNVYT